MSQEATPQKPIYSKVKQDDGSATGMFSISCDEGWRTSVVCTDMYEWSADWLLGVLASRPYAPDADR